MERRRRLERAHFETVRTWTEGSLRPNPFVLMHHGLHAAFKSRHLAGAGLENLLRIETRRVRIRLPHLPRSFDGFRIGLVSDMHLGSTPELGPAIVRALESVRADLCIFTGDFRFYLHRPVPTLDAELRRIAAAVRAPFGFFGILGNHDTLDDAIAAEQAGIRMLVNESVRIERNGGTVWLAGVDDPHTYRLADLDRALAHIPAGAFVILAAHTSEIGNDAAKSGVSLYLCGHTHGGQICLPGGVPMITCTRAPRSRARGLWRLDGMTAYTSPGVGGSIVPARFNCPGEVIVLEMRNGRTQADLLRRSEPGGPRGKFA